MKRRPVAILALLVLGASGAGELLSAGCGSDLAVSRDDAGPAAPPDPCAGDSAPAYCVPPEASASSCQYGKPDGVCDITVEDCSCEDCAAMALCTSMCVDDGACNPGAGEDCSCVDCYRRSEGCAPKPVGCHTDGICSAIDDDCVCPDCALDRFCQSCAGNGYCAEYLEACSCADCQNSPRCLPDGGGDAAEDAGAGGSDAGEAGSDAGAGDASEDATAIDASDADASGGAAGSGGSGGASAAGGGPGGLAGSSGKGGG